MPKTKACWRNSIGCTRELKLRVERRGERFSAFASTNGKSWRLYAVQLLALAAAVYVGPALTSHNPQAEAKASFRDYTESK